VRFSPDGRLLVSGHSSTLVAMSSELHFNNERIYCWDTATGKKLWQIEGHWNEIASLAIAPDGKTLASIGHFGPVHLWETATGKHRRTFAAWANWVEGSSFYREDLRRSLAFSPDGRALALAGPDDRIHLWETASGVPLPSLGGHKGRVLTIAFAADGKTL